MTPLVALMVTQAYALGLMAVGVWTLVEGKLSLFRTATALSVNLALVWTFTTQTGWFDAWLFFLLVDALTAWAVLRPPHGVTQAIIGALLLVQCAVHVAYALVDDRCVQSDYLDILTAVGWAQLVTLAGGTGYERGKQIAVRVRTLGNREVALAISRRSVEGSE